MWNIINVLLFLRWGIVSSPFLFHKIKYLKTMSREDKLELYNKAKDAYYNGVEIMSDQEFDILEKEISFFNPFIISR